MIHWHEYKQYKKMAETIYKNGNNNPFIEIHINRFDFGIITYDEMIENIIYILSDYKHVKPQSYDK